MEAVPRLPMISFDLKASTDIVSFSAKLKQYISGFYHEDPESYNTEIYNLESLRAAAVRPAIDVSGCQLLKKYYCQLHFLKSRFPMEDGQPCATYFSWKDSYSNMVCSVPDIDFELMNILYNIGAIHSKLGSEDSRTTPEGMKMACTHFQCAAWAFQTVRTMYPQMVGLVLAPEIIQFMHLTCLAQAQECILEKSMMDNRKATIIAKVAVQVVDYYKQALTTVQTSVEEGTLSDLLGSRVYKDWIKYLNFKISYHKAIALLYQGQQAEEQQKMGERVSFYQAASEQLQDACKRASNLAHPQEISEALAFTGDVVEGKRKAAKNENEFIYHEDVPDKDALQEVKGASLVKGIAFNVNDPDVSGPDIFGRLVPMEAHEASSLYSEQKAQLLRQLGELVDNKDRALGEFMSSMQLDILSQMNQATGLTQDLVDRAAAMSARPTAIQDLVSAMGKLSNIYHDVEANLNEIDVLIKEEEKKEQEYQAQMGTRPPSIIATDLKREFIKYQEAHSKASDSNQNLHRAMTTHTANLKVLSLPLSQLKTQIPAVDLSKPEIDQDVLRDMESLVAKVEEMKNQRSLLWAQFHDAVKNDDITGLVVTKTPDKSLEQLFQQELQKHQRQAALIEQNMAAQENILKAFIDTYARFTNTRRHLQDVITKRATTLSALINSYDSYDDLLSKANKGLEFYNKLETNVTKLLQRIKSTCKVQDEEREQILAKLNKNTIIPASNTPKLKDYLNSKVKDNLDNKRTGNVSPVAIDAINSATYATVTPGIVSKVPDQSWPPAIRPAPVGSEMTTDTVSTSYAAEQTSYPSYPSAATYYNNYNQANATPASTLANTTFSYANNYNYGYSQQPYPSNTVEKDLSERMSNLLSNKQIGIENQTPAVGHSYGYMSTNANPQPLPSQNLYYPTSHTADSNITYGVENTAGYGAGLPQYSRNYDSSVAKFSNVAKPTSQPENPNVMAYPTATLQYSYSVQEPTTYTQTNTTTYLDSTGSQNTNAQIPTAYIQSSYPQSYVYQNTDSTYTPSDIASHAYVQPNSNFYTPTVSTSDTYATNTNVETQQFQVANNYTYPNQTSNTNEIYSASYNNAGLGSQDSTYLNQHNAYSQYAGQTDASLSYNSMSTNYYQYGGVQQIDPSVNYSTYATDSNVVPVTTVGATVGISTNITYGNPSQYTNYPPNDAVATVNSSTISENVSHQPLRKPKKETSNIDLLSGLDFTINQVPLMPQQNQVNTVSKEAGTSSKSVELLSPPTPNIIKSNTTIKSEEKCITKDVVNIEKKPLERQIQRKSFHDPEIAKQFIQEAEKFEKFVDILSTKTLNGPTSLDLKWKEISDKQEIDQQKRSISVARCYPMKNRFPDILPYDQTRVKLSSTKDDYINATFIRNVTQNSPLFIVTQSPIQATYNDFWTMVWEQHIEIIVGVISDSEISPDFYWPRSKDQPLSIGNISISAQEIVNKEHWIETELTLHQLQERNSRTVRHLQFTAWPTSLFPTLPVITSYVNEILKDQKALSSPVLVHCLAGIGRSGLLCLLISATLELLINPTIFPDLAAIGAKLCIARKNIIRDREHLKFAYIVFLHVVKELRTSKISQKKTVENSPEILQTTSVNDVIEDPLSMLDPLWATKKHT